MAYTNKFPSGSVKAPKAASPPAPKMGGAGRSNLRGMTMKQGMSKGGC